PIEIQVKRILCSTLGVDKNYDIMNKNFFALGGTSISSVRAIVRLRELGLELTLESFLKAPTIGDIVHDILKAKTMADVVNLFSPCLSPLPTSTGSKRSSFPHLDMHGKELESSEDEEDSSEATAATKFVLPALHPDIPSVVVAASGGRTGRRASQAIIPFKRPLRLNNLQTLPLSQAGDKTVVQDIVSKSFTYKNPLDIALGISRQSHMQMLESFWPRIIKDDLSFFIKDPKKGTVGVAINTNFFDEPQMSVPVCMEAVVEIHSQLEQSVRPVLQREEQHLSSTVGSNWLAGPAGAKNGWMHNVFLATHASLSPQDNVRLVVHLERELLRVANAKMFKGVFTINSNPLNQMVCEHYMGYSRQGSTKVSSFIYKDKKPFQTLPDDLLLIAMTKEL
ncbi:unnamed protein product, partial [Meganyctiphanes norvegica]